MNLKKYRIYLCVVMALFGTLSIPAKNSGIPSAYLGLCRALIAIVIIGGFQLIRGHKFDLREIKRCALTLFLSGAAIGCNWVLMFEAYDYTSVSTATLCYYFGPIITTAVCPFIFHERLTKKQIICTAMSTVGIVLLVGIGGGRGSDNIRGVCFALGAAVLYCVIVICNKFTAKIGGIDRALLQFIAAVIVLAPYVGLTDGFSLGDVSALNITCILLIGVIYSGIAYCMYFSAISALPGQEAMLLSYIDPLVAVIVSVTVLREPISATQILGGMLVIGFTIYNELSVGKKTVSHHGG